MHMTLSSRNSLEIVMDLRRLSKTPGLRDTWDDLSRLNSHRHRHRHHRRKTLLGFLAAGLRRLKQT